MEDSKLESSFFVPMCSDPTLVSVVLWIIYIYTNSPTIKAIRSLSNLLKTVVLSALLTAFHSVCDQKMGNDTTLPVFTTRILYK